MQPGDVDVLELTEPIDNAASLAVLGVKAEPRTASITEAAASRARYGLR